MNLKKVYRLYREERLTVRNLVEELGQARVERLVSSLDRYGLRASLHAPFAQLT